MSYTDVDVARMLGWDLDGKYLVRDECVFINTNFVGGYPSDGIPVQFGLSTPQNQCADSNAARYVLPWLISKVPELDLMVRHDCFTVTFSLNGKTAVIMGDHFGPTICRAALNTISGK